MDERHLVRCVNEQLCWICGKPLGRTSAFVIGPMCAVNRISAEPPSHPLCATFAAKACPFLSQPLAKRPGNADLEAKYGPLVQAGEPVLHNPGVTLIWYCQGYRVTPDKQGVLFEIGHPSRVLWFREGREATRQEALDGMMKGLPFLQAEAERYGPEAVRDLEWRLAEAAKLLPDP